MMVVNYSYTLIVNNQLVALCVFLSVLVCLFVVIARVKDKHAKKLSKDLETVEKNFRDLNDKNYELKDDLESLQKKVADFENADLRARNVMLDVLGKFFGGDDESSRKRKGHFFEGKCFPYSEMELEFDTPVQSTPVVQKKVQGDISLNSLKQIEEIFAEMGQVISFVSKDEPSQVQKMDNKIAGVLTKIDQMLARFQRGGQIDLMDVKVDDILSCVKSLEEDQSKDGNNISSILKATATLTGSEEDAGSIIGKLNAISKTVSNIDDELLNEESDFRKSLDDVVFSELSIDEKMKQINESLVGTYTKVISAPDDFEFDPAVINPTIESLVDELNGLLSALAMKTVIVHEDIDEDELRKLVIEHMHENDIS